MPPSAASSSSAAATAASAATADYEAIRNTIALYCIALDTKDWRLLRDGVFVRDVEAVYPFNEDAIMGVERLGKRIEERLVRFFVFLFVWLVG